MLDNMATKKTAPKTAPKASAKKKAEPKSVFATAITPPAPVQDVGHSTWATVVTTSMKKPRSWRDWQARQLDANRLK